MRNRLLSLFAALGVFAGQLSAVVVVEDFTWTGNAGSYWHDTGSWDGGKIPDDIATARAIFGPSARNAFIYYDEIYVQGLAFTGITQPYFLYGDYDTTHIGTGGIDYAPAGAIDSTIRNTVALAGNQTWNIQSGTLIIDGEITDTYEGSPGDATITKTGSGTLRLDSTDSSQWSGGLTLSAGRVAIGGAYDSTNYALGTGTLTFAGGTLVTDNLYGSDDAEVVLYNPVRSTGTISVESDLTLRIASNESSGGVTLTTDTTISSRGSTLYIDANIEQAGGDKKLTINSEGAVVLDGTNTYGGGTHVEKGLLIFGNPDAVPQVSSVNNTITVAALGYAGYASTEDFNSKFLAYFNRLQTFGTVGFDTDPLVLENGGTPNVFTQNVNLGGQVAMRQVRLGSATAAIFSGGLTPADGTNYRFGGGGGKLLVTSSLGGTGNLNVTSPAELPLTLRLSGQNSYQGGTHAEHSAVTFENAGSLPSTGSLTMGVGGYIGIAYEPANGLAGSFLGRFGTLATGSMIGFDSADIYGTYREITDAIDLSAGKYAGVMLGTSGNVGLSGVITPNASTYRLGAYKGGVLTVLSQLTGSNAVVIGHPDVQATVGDRNTSEFSRVYLANTANNYTGGTTLHPGHLIVGGVSGEATNALGTGALTVSGTNIDFGDDSVSAYLTPSTDGVTLPNAIILNANLDVGGVERIGTAGASGTDAASLPTSGFNFTGAISGAGKLLVGDENPVNLRLAGANTFTGGIYVRGGSTLTLGSDTAAGTGLLGFGSSGTTAYFETAAPVIGGLNTDGSYVTLGFSAPAPVLTVNQTENGKFEGNLYHLTNDTIRFVKTGSGTLRLQDGSISGGTSSNSLVGAAALPAATPVIGLQIDEGALVIGSSFFLNDQSATIQVNGGSLVLADGKYLNNPILVGNGGTLAGFGQFGSAVIGTGATLSPGFSESGNIGFLHFSNHLELAGGGTYEWHIGDPDPFAPGNRDGIFVGSANTLEITATAANRFMLKIISLDLSGQAGALAGLDPMHGSYTWSLASALSLTGSTDFLADPASVFNLDTTGFNTGGLTGSFNLSSSNNNLLLTFTPVPEPSTYALMALGLAFIGVTVWRKRRA